MSTYYLAPNAFKQPTLWRGDGGDAPAVAALDDGRLFVYDRHGAAALWHAGTAVLAPTEEQIEAAARGLHEDRGYRPSEWGKRHPDMRALYRSRARAVLAALAAHAEGAAT